MGPGIGIPLVLLGVLVLLVIGSTLFRAAVALANSTIGPVKLSPSIAWDWEAAEDEDDLEELRAKSRPLPEPGLGQGMLIVLVAGVLQLLVSFLLESVFRLDRARRGGDVGDWLPLHLVGAGIGFAVMTGIVAGMLPTTGKRAALATFYFYLIAVAVIGLVAGTIYFVLHSLD